jgi:hypothetical protein
MGRPGVTFAEAWSSSFAQDKYGAATTHWRKLEDRVHRGVGNPCPLLLIGLPASIVTFGEPAAVVEELMEEALQDADPAAPLVRTLPMFRAKCLKALAIDIEV